MFFQRGWKRGFVLWIDTNIFSQEQFALSEVTQARSVLAGLAQRLSEQSRAHQEHFQQAEQTSVDLFRAVEQQLEEQKRMVARQLLEAFDAGRTVLADRSAEVRPPLALESFLDQIRFFCC